MVGKFAFSFDRERFNGQHDTRQDALKTALVKVSELENTPEAVFVGKRVPVDPGAAGLAEMVLAAMRHRMREATGGNANGYLMRVNEHQLAELDDEIDRVVKSWLTKHNLSSNHSRVIAISEHPVPQPSMQANGNGSSEVKDLGDSDYPIALG